MAVNSWWRPHCAPISDLRNGVHVALAFTRVPLHKIPPGVTLSHAVYAEDDVVKLIGAGVTITDTMLRGLAVRGVESVMVEQADLERLRVDPMGDPTRLLACRECEAALPLRLSTGKHEGLSWFCSRCRTPYRGHLDADSSVTALGNLQIARFPIDRDRLEHPPHHVERAVRELAGVSYPGSERRASPRMALTIPVAAVPLNEVYVAIGDPLMLTTRNISVGGVALIHNAPIDSPLLAIELPAHADRPPIQLVVELLRRRELGAVWEIAGRFILDAI